MKKTIIFAVVMVICTFKYTAPCSSFSKETDNKLKTTVQKLINEHNLPGVVVGVWIPGQGEWTGALGHADLKTKKKMTLNDHFRIGSITKTFTVTAFLQLVDQGKLSLEDKVGKYIQNVPNGDKITLKQLANMTSGIPSYTKNKAWVEKFFKDKTRVWQTKEILDAAFSMPPSFKPGEDFEYSNTNIILLGLLIEKTTGMDLATYLKKNIFNPLKLSNTGLPTGGDLPAPYAHGYFQLPDNTYEDNTFRNTSWSFAAGGMVSTLHDLKIWSGALGTGELLSKEEFNQRLKWKKIGANTKDYHYMLGLGFDNGWLMHTGTVPGYNTMVAYLPEKKAVFVCLINTDKDLTVDAKTIRPVMLIFKKIAEIILPQNIPASPLYND